MSLLLTLNIFHISCSSVSVVNFEQVNADYRTCNLTKAAIRCRYAPGYFPNILRTTFYHTTVAGRYHYKLSYFEKQSLAKKVFLKISQSLTPVLESLFNKVAGLRPSTLLKNRLWRRCFPVNFGKFLRTPPVTVSTF